MTSDSSFASFVSNAIEHHGLSKVDLYRWIAEASKNVANAKEVNDAAVKERLRQARNRQTDAYEFPFLPEIISFFQTKQKNATASRIQHIVFQQMHDLGMIDGVLAPEAPENAMLRWLLFPPKESSECKKDVNDWMERCQAGDYSLYRQMIALYELLEPSPIHRPIRKLISVDLARIALYNSDYSEAFRICRTVEQSWHTSVAPFGKPSDEDVNWYLRALRIMAMAVSNMFSYSSFAVSNGYFFRASAALEECLAKAWLDRASYLEHLSTLHHRRLRMLTRLFTMGDASQVQELEEAVSALENVLAEREQLCKTEGNDPDILLKESAPYDTLARAYALIATYRFSLVQEAAESLTGDPNSDLGDEMLAKAKAHSENAVRRKGINLNDAPKIHTDPTRILAFIRASTTWIIIACAEITKDPSRRGKGIHEIKDQIRDIFDMVGPTMHRHSQSSLSYVARYVDRVMAGQPFGHQGGTADSLRYFMDVVSSRSHQLRLEQDTRVPAELLFGANLTEPSDWDEQADALYHANRYSGSRPTG